MHRHETDIDRIRRECRDFLRQHSLLTWYHRTQGSTKDTTGVYAEHEHLFTSETLAVVVAAMNASSEGPERRALEYLHAYLMQETIYAETPELDDAIGNFLGNAVFLIDGQEYDFQELSSLLGREPDPARRADLSHAATPILRDLQPRMIEKIRRHEELARSFGLPGYIELSERLRATSFATLAEQARAFLDDTHAAMHRLLEWAVPRRLGIAVTGLRRPDLPALLRHPRADAFFPREGIVAVMDRFLDQLGIDPGVVIIDDEDRPKKNPRAACFPIDVPGDVRISIKPGGGLEDYTTWFHEMGHAMHFAHTATPVFEFQQLGPSAVSEAFAFLFESVFESRYFLREEMGLSVEAVEETARHGAFVKLYMVRRHCAKLLYELDLFGGVMDPRDSYRRHLSRAYGIDLTAEDAERFLLDMDDFFYCADYLRAWFLESQLERALTSRFGERWYRTVEAGTFLKDLWSRGSRETAEEIAASIGDHGVTPHALVARLTSAAAEGGIGE
ncbi:MAG: hypothetical protein IT350_12295 [Deltaproteobacteria bacterium]|nr:hypothetical protein [Deltaproteobacteria bacterium]